MRLAWFVALFQTSRGRVMADSRDLVMFTSCRSGVFGAFQNAVGPTMAHDNTRNGYPTEMAQASSDEAAPTNETPLLRER